jgi:hypothetical protein
MRITSTTRTRPTKMAILWKKAAISMATATIAIWNGTPTRTPMHRPRPLPEVGTSCTCTRIRLHAHVHDIHCRGLDFIPVSNVPSNTGVTRSFCTIVYVKRNTKYTKDRLGILSYANNDQQAPHHGAPRAIYDSLSLSLSIVTALYFSSNYTFCCSLPLLLSCLVLSCPFSCTLRYAATPCI